MIRIALSTVAVLALGACANQPYGPYVPDARLESPGPVLAASYADAPSAQPALEPIAPPPAETVVAVIAPEPAAAAEPAPMLHAQAAPAVVVDAQPLPLDPKLLPPNTAPGDCVARIADGATYRWERTACAAEQGPAVYAAQAYQQSYAYSAYPSAPPPAYAPDYRYAGRDTQGYLVWPGKVPAR